MVARPLLSDRTISGLRTLVGRLLNSTCTITTPGTGTQNAQGHTIPGTEATTSTQLCRLEPARRVTGGALSEAVRQASLTGRTVWLVTMAYNATVSRKARISVNGKTMEVASVIQGQTQAADTSLICIEES